jgi:hypothetical protein
LDQLVKAQLKAVSKGKSFTFGRIDKPNEGSLPPLEKQQEQTLLTTLSAAMASRRLQITEEIPEDDDDWSDEEWE